MQARVNRDKVGQSDSSGLGKVLTLLAGNSIEKGRKVAIKIGFDLAGRGCKSRGSSSLSLGNRLGYYF